MRSNTPLPNIWPCAYFKSKEIIKRCYNPFLTVSCYNEWTICNNCCVPTQVCPYCLLYFLIFRKIFFFTFSDEIFNQHSSYGVDSDIGIYGENKFSVSKERSFGKFMSRLCFIITFGKIGIYYFFLVKFLTNTFFKVCRLWLNWNLKWTKLVDSYMNADTHYHFIQNEAWNFGQEKLKCVSMYVFVHHWIFFYHIKHWCNRNLHILKLCS